MKKIALLVLALTSTSVCAHMTREEYDPKPMVEGNRRVDELIEWHKNHPGEMPPLTEQEKYEFFTKKGMPVPGSGATVVDVKKFQIPGGQSAAVNKFNADIEAKGYHEEISKRAKILLDMPEIAEKEYDDRRTIAVDPHDTHLYETKVNLSMAYNYKGAPNNLTTRIIGYSPESVFINNGWAGAVEFFVPAFGGVCAFHEVNIELTKSAAYIPQEIAKNIVNGKITTMNAVGSKESGFIYEMEWWDTKFKRSIECAHEGYYSASIGEAVMKLAKQIDSDLDIS